MRASWAGNEIAAAPGAAAGAPASPAALERARKNTKPRRVTAAGAIGFTGEVYIGYAPPS